MIVVQASVSAPVINSSADAYRPYIDCYWSYIPDDWRFSFDNDAATKNMLAAVAGRCRVERASALNAAETLYNRFPVVRERGDARDRAEKGLLGSWFDQILSKMFGRGHAKAEEFAGCIQRLGEAQVRKVV